MFFIVTVITALNWLLNIIIVNKLCKLIINKLTRGELYHYIANSLASATLTPRPFLTSKKHKEQFVLLRLWEQMNFYQEGIELFMSN